MPRSELRAGIEHVEYFKAIPWCAKIMNDPRYTIQPVLSRMPGGTTEDSYVSETLHTERTIRKMLTVNSLPDETQNPPIQEVMTFFELGDGLHSFPGMCHGGFTATMMDEEMGIMLFVNQEYVNQKTGILSAQITSMTAYLNLRYLAPVRTSCIVLATAKVVKSEGRKLFVRGTIKDSERRELVVAECLFIKAKDDPRLSSLL